MTDSPLGGPADGENLADWAARMLSEVPDAVRFLCPDCRNFRIPGLCPHVAPELSFPSSPLTILEQNAAMEHELVVSRERAGFSRSEAMQILCTALTAVIMKGSGSD
jgi:hypothetical protein